MNDAEQTADVYKRKWLRIEHRDRWILPAGVSLIVFGQGMVAMVGIPGRLTSWVAWALLVFVTMVAFLVTWTYGRTRHNAGWDAGQLVARGWRGRELER